MTEVNSISEFELIRRLDSVLAEEMASISRRQNIVLGIGDAAAIIRPGVENQVITTDTMVDGVHFLMDSINMRDLGWKSLAANGLMEDFTHAVCGHYHTPTTMYINDTRVWVNGSTESYNTFAQEQLASMGRPSQFCLFVKPNKGVTAEYLVQLIN